MTKPIRVLHMIGSLNIGGSQSMVMNLYKAIDRNIIQFDFIIDHKDHLYFKTEIEKLGGKIYVMPSFKGWNIIQVKKAWKDFFEEHEEYNIIHSHVRSYASLYLPIAKKYGLKTIIHSHSTSNGTGFSSVIKALLQFPLRYQVDYFFGCSREAGEWLYGKKICRSDKFFVVKNAIDAENLIFDSEKRMSSREALGLSDEFVLGFLARVSKPKNPLFVIEVFYEIKKHDLSSKLLFVGDGELLDSVKTKAHELGIVKDIIFVGERTDIANMFWTMDYYILPSIWEGLGMTLVEAQASGISCICSENIPKEAIVTDLVEQLSLSVGPGAWAEKIINVRKERMNSFLMIKNAGYDIVDNSEKISKFYLKTVEECI